MFFFSLHISSVQMKCAREYVCSVLCITHAAVGRIKNSEFFDTWIHLLFARVWSSLSSPANGMNVFFSNMYTVDLISVPLRVANQFICILWVTGIISTVSWCACDMKQWKYWRDEFSTAEGRMLHNKFKSSCSMAGSLCDANGCEIGQLAEHCATLLKHACVCC